MKDSLSLHIEALIFASEQPLSIREIKRCLETAFETSFETGYLQEQVDALTKRYAQEHSAFELVHVAKGYQFRTKEAYHETIGVLLKQKSRKKLSKSALETLSIIAYRQPVTKGELEKIRGVSCQYALHKLLEKDLIEIKGRAEEVGRPLIYATSSKFMEHFGLSSLKDLPKLREFKQEENEIGERVDS